MYDEAQKTNLEIACFATTRIAATILPFGRTIYNFLGISPRGKKFSSWEELRRKQKEAKNLLHFNREKHCLVVIDKVSVLDPNLLAVIDQRLRRLTGNLEEKFRNFPRHAKHHLILCYMSSRI